MRFYFLRGRGQRAAQTIRPVMTSDLSRAKWQIIYYLAKRDSAPEEQIVNSIGFDYGTTMAALRSLKAGRFIGEEGREEMEE